MENTKVEMKEEIENGRHAIAVIEFVFECERVNLIYDKHYRICSRRSLMFFNKYLVTPLWNVYEDEDTGHKEKIVNFETFYVNVIMPMLGTNKKINIDTLLDDLPY